MEGKRTLLILGAGASACYLNKERKIPAQNDILKSFIYPKISRSSSNIRIEECVDTNGLTHSTLLADYLINKYHLNRNDDNALTEYWEELSHKKLNLESLYEELETDLSSEGIKAKNDFVAILMAKIRFGVGERLEVDLCKYHLKVARNLEPMDCVVNFNWDTLIDDALLYACPFWFPYTGYGVKIAGLQGEFFNKAHSINSLVHLYHLHGSIGLYDPIDDKIKNRSRAAMVVGPKGLSIGYEMCELAGIKKPEGNKANEPIVQKREITNEEQALLDRGCIRIGDKEKIWLQPIFVTPSRSKPEYNNWYVAELKKIIHARLPQTEQIIIIGYSFPPSDFDHLASVFVKEVIPRDTDIRCINIENTDALYQEKVKHIFAREFIDISISDFKAYCNKLPI